MINTYEAIMSADDKLDSETFSAAQEALGPKIEGLGLDWGTKDEATKKANIETAQATADEFFKCS